MEKILEIKNLKTNFHTEEGIVPAVDEVTLHINKGETLGVVGESGCGKSVTALSVMRLIPSPPGKITGGEILFEGKNLLKFSEDEMRKIRGDAISMIFQEPMTSLNPVFTCGDQIAEVLKLHQGLGNKEAMERAVEMLRKVGISLPEQRVKEYPHYLSGGMRQRVMIAMALSCNPKLLIADEPTTALDVTIQAQILHLMKKLKEDFGTAIMLITHDLGVVAEMAQRVVVMYAGKVVEEADIVSLFRKPHHPYTRGLLESVPQIDGGRTHLHVIEGMVPNPLHMPQGCRFNPRCREAMALCQEKIPPLSKVGENHQVACWLHVDSMAKGVSA